MTAPATCKKHGLAAGPDGRCVICRREGSGTKGRPKSGWNIVFYGGVAITAVAAIVVAAVLIGRGGASPPSELEALGEIATAPEEPVAVASTSKATTSKRRSSSAEEETDLERARRLQKEVEDRRRDEREEARRLEQARRSVPVTMYMTDW